MNQRPRGLDLSKAIPGFLQYRLAEGLSPNTVSGYERDLKFWLERLGDRDVGQITPAQLLDVLNSLRNGYVPRHITGDNDRPLSDKTVYNFYVSISAFFTWASREFEIPNPMKKVPRPRVPEDPPVEPFKREDVEALIKACDYCTEADTHDRRKFVMRRSTGRRDKAILLMLLDTGLRASELCALRVADVDQKTGRVRVRAGEEGKAKGRKGRTVYAGKAARRFLWRSLADREEGEDPETPLFIGKFGRPLTRDALRRVIAALGEKAGVKKAHPHRFRHTFAITYLRSGGDLFTLQRLLGHSTLEMVQHYANVAEIDIEQAHRRASPADNWRL
ncbi:MAG: tyrosine-type recombinase/integrase [Anaerolineales bacterium]|nr:tyrosine-type recombinase/integrase [Anaerolineales bacterium]